METTTGPLGQGCGNTVGMAIASRYLANHFNRPDFAVFDYDVYALCSDGDMMEGVSSEAASIAGHLALGNLCWIYDNNHISIEGTTSLAFTEDVGARFRAYGWNVEHVGDANDCDALFAALEGFRQNRKSPTLIIVDSHIAYGSPHKHDSCVRPWRAAGRIGSQTGKAFLWLAGRREVPGSRRCARTFRCAIRRAWAQNLRRLVRGVESISRALSRARARTRSMENGELPKGWDSRSADFPADAKGMATREASGKVLNAIASHVPLVAWRFGRSRAVDQNPDQRGW